MINRTLKIRERVACHRFFGGAMSRKGLWIGIAILVVVALALIWILTGSRNLSLVVLLDDTGGLEADAPVTWKGFTFGNVTGIQPLVDNQIGATINPNED